MSHSTNVSAFRPTAFDTVATNFWQDFVHGNPIGGGAAYENKLRECQLDGSLGSLQQLDRLLLAIKKDLQKRGYDEKMVLQQTSFRNLLLFIMFYTGQVIANELQQSGSWQPLANMEQYYPQIAFGNHDNKFYYLAAFFPQSFLANTRIPPMFVLLTLGARLFGSFERQFAEPLMGELAPESLYWAVTGYVQMVANFGQSGQTVVKTPIQPPPKQGIPSKIAQTAPKAMNQQTPPQPKQPQQISKTQQQGIPSKIAQTAPKVSAEPVQAPTTQPQPDLVGGISSSLDLQSSATHHARQPLPQKAEQPLSQNPFDELAQSFVTNDLTIDDALMQTSVIQNPNHHNLARNTPIDPNPSVTAPVARNPITQSSIDEQALLSQTPQIAQPVTNAHAQIEQAMRANAQRTESKSEPKPNMQLHLQSEPPKRPAPPPASHHKEHRFQAGGLAPMTLAPPIVTVKPTNKNTPQNPPVTEALTQHAMPADGLGQMPKNPPVSATDSIDQSSNTHHVPKQSPVPPPKKSIASPPANNKTADKDVFSELQRDLVNLPASNTTEDVKYQQLKTVLDQYDALLEEKIARGEREISFTDIELSSIQRAVYNAKKLSDMGNTNAMLTYALCCFKGIAMPQDLEQGAVWVHNAADMNDVRAQKFLSRLYYQGLGVEQSIRQGEYWLEKAAKNGHPEAKKIQAQLSHIKIMKDDYQEEVKKDKRYALIFLAMGIIVVLALWVLSLFV